MDTFNRYFDSQLEIRKKEWLDEYVRTMGGLDLGMSVELVMSMCEQVAAAATARFIQFEKFIGLLQEGTVAAIKLSSARTEQRSMGLDGTKAKLNQFDELVSLYNRALLNKTVQPIVEKVEYHSPRNIQQYTNAFRL
jgi:hypothetical protein